jgi:acyl carrier protein
MNKNEIFTRLTEVFQDIFDDENITVDETTTPDDIEDWDSLEHIRLISAIESEFKVRFNMSQISAMKNVGEMADIISEKVTK